MGLREEIAKRPRTVVFLSSLCVVAMGAAAFSTYNKGGAPPLPKIPGEAFYTIDGGATLFTDSLWKDPPFDQNGHEAVRAYVFTCDGGAHHWVQYLEKWSDKDKAQRALAKTGPPGSVAMPDEQGILVKKPDGGEWVPRKNRSSVAITTPKCPDGMGTNPPASVQP